MRCSLGMWRRALQIQFFALDEIDSQRMGIDAGQTLFQGLEDEAVELGVFPLSRDF